jgi:hypothetical protein
MFKKSMLSLLAAAFSAILSMPVQAQLYGTSPFQNGGGDMGALYRFDADTGAYLMGSGLQVTLAGFTITGINSITVDPTDGLVYAVLKLASVSGRVLATIDVNTGVATQIGNLGDNFSSISFREDGQLFGVTGDGATVPETLFLINKASAATVVAQALGNGADGEVIAYNPVDDLFYHWSGNGTVVFESIQSVPPYTVTSIPVIGTTNGETFGAVWDGCRDLLIGSNISSSFNLWNTNGTVGPAFGTNPDDIRGLALIGGSACDVDLVISISAMPAVPTVGNPVTLTVSVLNNGPARALTPSVAVSLAANITGAVTSGCAGDPAGVPTCALPKLYQGDTASFTITGNFGAGAGTTTVTATTASDETAVADNTASLLLGASIDVVPTAGLVTTEAGGTAAFTVVLSAQPTSDVTVPVSSNDTSEGTVSTASLVFTSANWDVPQTVTVTGVDDVQIDGDVAYSIVLDPATSADLIFNGLDPTDVGVSNADNDVAGVTVAPPPVPTTTEAGGTAAFTVVLSAQPAGDVSFPVASNDVTEGTASVVGVTFTSLDWNVPQTITVTGVDDFVVDGDVGYSIALGATTSVDPNFNAIDPADVALTNLDNDGAGVTVVPTTGLATDESGSTDSFTVVLTAQPASDVSIAISSSDATEASAAPASLTFTSLNWNVPQTVTVTGVDDLLIDGPQPFTIVTGATASADAGFNGLDVSDVGGINGDDDVVSVPVPGPGGLALLALVLTVLTAVALRLRQPVTQAGDNGHNR